MTDQEIIALYWKRDERAVVETAEKYADYCASIAWNILHSRNDAEECVNDTWFRTWNDIPPTRPNIFSAYLGTITRNLSLSRYRAQNAQKRRGDRLSVAYEELGESVPDRISVEQLANTHALGELLNRFLTNLPPKDCCMLLRRYWYMDGIEQIAGRYGMTESAVRSKLHRIRTKLKRYLEQEGVVL